MVMKMFQRPEVRLANEIENANRTNNPEKSSTELRAELTRDLQPVIQLGRSDLIVQAYQALVRLYGNANQASRAVETIEEMRQHEFAVEASLDSILALIYNHGLAEHELIQLCRWLAVTPRFREAVPGLKQAIEERFRHNAPLIEMLADALVQSDLYEEAVQRYERAVEIRPEEGPRLEGKLQRVLELSPDLASAERLLGLVLYRQNSFPLAALHLARAVELGVRDEASLLSLADCSLEVARWDGIVAVFQLLFNHQANPVEVIRRCERFAEIYPKKDATFRQIERIWGDLYMRQQRPAEAHLCYQAALQGLEPGLSEADAAFTTELVTRLAAIAEESSLTLRAETLITAGHAHILLKQPEPALLAFQKAIQSDPMLVQQVLEGLGRQMAVLPAFSPAYFETANLLITQQDDPGAVNLINQIRQKFPQDREQLIALAKRLLLQLEGTGGDADLAHSSRAEVFRGVLSALAEEQGAAAHTLEALNTLDRILRVFGGRQAGYVRDQLRKQNLYKTHAVDAHLLEGDCYLEENQFSEALAAYLRAPLSAASKDKILAHLEQLIQRDAKHLEGMQEAAKICLNQSAVEQAVGYLQRAYEREAVGGGKIVLQLLTPLDESGMLEKSGLQLLATALIDTGEEKQLEKAVDVLTRLFRKDNRLANWILSQCQRVRQKSKQSWPSYYLATRWMAEVLALDGRCQDAARTYLELLALPSADIPALTASLEKLVKQDPEQELSWLVLGDARLRSKKPDFAAVVDAYTRALDDALQDIASQVLERLDDLLPRLKGEGEARMRAQLLRARSLAYLHRVDEAAAELRKMLSHFGEAATAGMINVCELLPDEPEKWFLRAEVEHQRKAGDEVCSWLHRVIEQGQQADWLRVEKWLVDLKKAYPRHGGIHLEHVQALIRLGNVNAASQELSEIAKEFPDVRTQARHMSRELTHTSATPETWMGMAKSSEAGDDVAEALQALEHAWIEPGLQQQCQELLLRLIKRHPRSAPVLRALVTVETRMATPQTLEQAVEHGSLWLKAAQGEASDICAELETILALVSSGKQSGGAVEMDARRVLADAYLAASQPDKAAAQFNALLAGWKDQVKHVIGRCQAALGKQDALSLRLTLISAFIQNQQVEPALAACQQIDYPDKASRQAMAGACQSVIQAAGDNSWLAARAQAILMEWQARLQDAAQVADCAARAAVADRDLTLALSQRLLELGWDEASQIRFRFASAALLRDGGEDTFAVSVARYEELAEINFPSLAQPVLDELARFPDNYWPRWKLMLEIWLGLGPEVYPAVYAALDRLQAIFGEEHLAHIFATLDTMEGSVPGVHLQRARVLERAGSLQQSADALLRLQAEVPQQFDAVQENLRGLVERHPQEYLFQVALGDALLAEKHWQEALEVYWQVQQKDKAWSEGLVGRYEKLLVEIPAELLVHRALTEAHWTLANPLETARYLDSWTDLPQADLAETQKFLSKLVKKFASCGYGWYGLGKLAFRQGNYDDAIQHLERARKEGVPESVVTLLNDMLGQAYQKTDCLELAREAMRRAVAHTPDDLSLRQRLLAIRLDLLDSAIQQQEERVQHGGNLLEDRLCLADLLQQRGEHPRATGLLQTIISEGNGNARVHMALARSFMSQRYFHLAATSLEYAIQTGELDGEQTKEALYRLAQTYRRQLRYDEALKAVQKIIAVDVNYQNVMQLADAIEREKVSAQQNPVLVRPSSQKLPTRVEER